MKTQTVYPSTMMKITCPNCQAEGTVKRDKPPDKDFKVLCPKCKEGFLVKVNLRRYYRKDVSIPIAYWTLEPDGRVQKRRTGTIVDISREGLGIESPVRDYSPTFHREGNLYELSFSLPPKQIPLTVQGEVVRIIKTEGSKTFKIGVSFFNLDRFPTEEIGFFLLP
jgi:predicted Zn finger-like uncharacterized protein